MHSHAIFTIATMPKKDLISKQLLRQLAVDFSNQLFGRSIVEAELLSSEQPHVEEWIMDNY